MNINRYWLEGYKDKGNSDELQRLVDDIDSRLTRVQIVDNAPRSL